VPRPHSRLQRLLAKLAATQAELHEPVADPPRDPWHAILYENVVYLVNDAARQRAFAALRDATDLDRKAIARAPDEVLLTATRHGKMAAQRVAKLRECAAVFATTGDPRELVDLPRAKARAALQQFPGIGAASVDRVLLFAGKSDVFAVEGNGLRTLLRLGFGTEAKSYQTSYRSAQLAAASEVPATAAARIEAYRVLRRHGMTTCRQTPQCATCVVAADCPQRRGT
jgi:endonuclease III